MLYQVLGFVNIALILIITAPYWLRFLNTKLFHIQKPWFNKLIKFLRPLHKVLAIVLLFVMGVHGFLALGGFRLHTGTVTAASFLITVILGILFYALRKPVFFKAHKIMALVSVILVAVHLLAPNLLSSMA